MQKLCLVAIDIRSTHNVGSLLRSADGFSADVILVGITPRPMGDPQENRLPYVVNKAHRDIAKTALGAEKSVRWNYFKDTVAAFQYLKNEGYEIFAIEQDDNSDDIRELKLVSPTALVFGPEVTGLNKKTLELCDKIYEITMTGKKESFNVAVSAGIALYQARI